MGTLYSQKPRDLRTSHTTDSLDGYIAMLVKLAKKHGISVSDAIAAADMLERQRFNYLYVDNGDTFDEQMAGIGEELQRIAAALEALFPSETE